ncbi:hypothetical protein [Rhizobium leucaenae]|uniref:Uncharacterized protein n=1 Tax=Rhizobium leucaenae TaxID=29450 RepID=A0A7W6ZY22_9HYPH|nr:hypothetical protein [Rhizobium leucaenae]MBB4570754.1 hypothetical protein [Rhizobium leucaenae]
MHLTDTKVIHEGNMVKVQFFGEGGEVVSVQINSGGVQMDDIAAIDQAKVMMVQLTAFGTRDGGGSLNAYDAFSNGNFDRGQPYPPVDKANTKH